ncbi:MAG: hypothetical protein QM790_05450 [Nibricoccus sp.]
MNTENLVIQQTRLASIIGGLGYPNPDDDSPIWKWPHGPGPVAHSWHDYLSWVALNPQPLPPKERFASAVAGVLIERAYRVSEMGTLFASQQRAFGSSFMAEFDDAGGWCGTLGRWELLQKLLEWLRHHRPNPPPPEPWWKQRLSQNEIIVIGGRVAFAAESFGDSTVRSAMLKVGGTLMEQGINLDQKIGQRQAVPAAEQV